MTKMWERLKTISCLSLFWLKPPYKKKKEVISDSENLRRNDNGMTCLVAMKKAAISVTQSILITKFIPIGLYRGVILLHAEKNPNFT